MLNVAIEQFACKNKLIPRLMWRHSASNLNITAPSPLMVNRWSVAKVANRDKTKQIISIKAPKLLVADANKPSKPTKQQIKQACDEWAAFMLRQYLKQKSLSD